MFLVVSTSAVDCLERLVSDMIYYVSSGTLNPIHSLTHLFSLSSIIWYWSKAVMLFTAGKVIVAYCQVSD